MTLPLAEKDIEFLSAQTKGESPSSHWIPKTISLLHNPKSNRVDTIEGEGGTMYKLSSVVSYVYDHAEKDPSLRGHLVSSIRIHPSYGKAKAEFVDLPAWYLFNDFHVVSLGGPSAIDEARTVDMNWKLPCMLYYTRVDIDQRSPIQKYVNPITSKVFMKHSAPLCKSINPKSQTFTQLTEDQLPKRGDYVALDAEFVSLKLEEAAVTRERITTKSGHFSLARVSVIADCYAKGGEEKEKSEEDKLEDVLPFIDDYIATREPIAAYLTRFSGIVPGDLDPVLSPYHVTTLKSSYLKLRYLVDSGCIFVGHGLNRDFRVINIIVPDDQVRDTVELYHLDRQRKISLRFLASYLLSLDIQSTTHCSTEDARTALVLYKVYLKRKKTGKFDSLLAEIYKAGRSKNWK
eukprot:TRINITY_DN6394_c0_g1_i1.p1 TRINITY_DN6394_c0_g1~~TRINITY_DN6394_c0_g1_i1.p1  ORF type:complete len:474 (+),score=72.40 TRINITY_DN6394_c0_g1_i1:213-1424(+)